MTYRTAALFLLQFAASTVTTENAQSSRFAIAFVPSFPTQSRQKINSNQSSRVGNEFRSSNCLFSTASPPGEANQSKTESYLDLSHYSSQRAFNLALEDIATEISSKKNRNLDVISRASIAEALVTKLEIAMNEGTAPFDTDIVTYNTLMKVWAKAAQTLADGRGRGDVNQVIHAMDDVPEELTRGGVYTAKDAADRALSILNEVEQKYLTGETKVAPNTFGYNIVLDGLHKCGAYHATDSVQDLFNKMKQWSSEGVEHPDEDEEYVNGDVSMWKRARPDAITYSIVMESIGNSRDYGTMSMVEELLGELEAEYEKTQDPDLKPVTRVANSAINSFLRNSSGNRGKTSSNKAWLSAKKVHEILNSLNKKWKKTGDSSYQPDITTITMVIDAYARCTDVAATERGEFLFEKIHRDWEQSGDSKLKPSSKTFTVMINSWAKSWDQRAPSKVEKLLELMEEMYADDVKAGNGETSTVKPSIRTYTAAMGAWTRSRDNTKSQRTLKILKKVSDMYKETGDEAIKPTLFTYNIAIDSCARSGGNPEESAQALKIAFAVNKAISAAKLEPNHITYSTLLKAAGKLLPAGDQRNEICKAVFGKCVAKGYVDTNVLKALEQASDRDVYYDLIGEMADRNGHVHFDKIPKEWCKNVTDKYY